MFFKGRPQGQSSTAHGAFRSRKSFWAFVVNEERITNNKKKKGVLLQFFFFFYSPGFDEHECTDCVSRGWAKEEGIKEKEDEEKGKKKEKRRLNRAMLLAPKNSKCFEGLVLLVLLEFFLFFFYVRIPSQLGNKRQTRMDFYVSRCRNPSMDNVAAILSGTKKEKRQNCSFFFFRAPELASTGPWTRFSLSPSSSVPVVKVVCLRYTHISHTHTHTH